MKGKKLYFTHEGTETNKPRKPMTRASTKRLAPIGKDTFEIPIEIIVPHESEQLHEIQHHEEKDDQKIKRLKTQLKEAQDMNVKLREENREIKMKFAEHMDQCEDIPTKTKIMTRKRLPLHRQVKNLYGRNRAMQAENRPLREELKTLKRKISKRNLELLVEAVASR